jgi:hypothetical protein
MLLLVILYLFIYLDVLIYIMRRDGGQDHERQLTGNGRATASTRSCALVPLLPDKPQGESFSTKDSQTSWSPEDVPQPPVNML